MNRAQRRNAKSQTGGSKIGRWIAYGTVILVIAGIIAAIGYSNQATRLASLPPAIAVITPGQIAPEFTATTNAGPFDLDKATKPVLLEVFATWCPHCQHETRIMNNLYSRYGKSIDIVAVSGSNMASDRQSPESQNDVDAFAAYFGVRYPIGYDASLSVANAYLQGGFPTIVMIDREHRVLDIGSGEIAQSKLERWIHQAAP